MTLSTLPAGDPRDLGFDPDRLAAIGPAMQAYVDNGQEPHLLTPPPTSRTPRRN